MKNHEFETKNLTEGRLLGLLVAGFYGLFTLLLDSNTQMVTWPWVFLWQITLILPVVWLLWQLGQQRSIQPLGNKLDWIVGLTVIGLVVSAVTSEFSNQARWYAWAALCFFATLYAINNWLISSHRRYQLLIGQGYLNIAFIILSLILWTSQIFLPELGRLNQLRQYGVNLPFDFSVLELRNGIPIGHQNYVAGYLVLAIPLLIGLSLLETKKRRWLWVAGVILGLINLYTTSSRGGWLALTVLGVVSFVILLFRSNLPRQWLGLGGVGVLAILTVLILANNRLRSLITATVSGQTGGEFSYRIITTATGWQIGNRHLGFGAGTGSVPLLYQQYRPEWAGREAELAYQLHSTPAHLWAELGLWGIAVLLSAIALFLYLGLKWFRVISINPLAVPKSDRIIIWSIYGSLLAYAVISLTDYQLDNVCISGTLMIFLAVSASAFRQVLATNQTLINHKISQGLTLAGLAILLIVGIWLVPIHYAWNLSNVGFFNLSQQEATTDPQEKQKLTTAFIQRLTQAHQLVSWEPYYSYQLGWNLGNFALTTTNPQQQQRLLDEGISWFKLGNKVSPYQEFGHTNLAWLLMLKRNPQAATQEFARSAQLVPAKRGVFYGLGLSLLEQGKISLAVDAIALEALRDPLLITSPIWKSPQFQPLSTQVLTFLEAQYTALLQKYSQPGALNTYLHQSRGGLHWWQGNLKAASADLATYGSNVSKRVLAVAEQGKLPQLDATASSLAIASWFDSANRPTLLQQAWVTATRTFPPPQLMQELLTGMAKSATFEQWLKQNAPTVQYRRTRLGFGVLSRHDDGSPPIDFLTVSENAAITNFFTELLPSAIYLPELDLALRESRNTLLRNVSDYSLK